MSEWWHSLDCREAGHEGGRTESKQESRTGGRQDRSEAGHEEVRKGRRQGRSEAGLKGGRIEREGCRTG